MLTNLEFLAAIHNVNKLIEDTWPCSKRHNAD